MIAPFSFRASSDAISSAVERAVEGVALAEVLGDRDPVARARVGAGERPAGGLRVEDETPRHDRVEVDGRFPVPELAAVEVARVAVEAGDPVPPEEDVAGRLHEPLALDDPPPVVLVPAVPEIGLQHLDWWN